MKLLTIADVADRFQVSKKTVRRWVKAGELRPVFLGERLPRFLPDDVDAFVERRRDDPPVPKPAPVVALAAVAGGRSTGTFSERVKSRR